MMTESAAKVPEEVRESVASGAPVREPPETECPTTDDTRGASLSHEAQESVDPSLEVVSTKSNQPQKTPQTGQTSTESLEEEGTTTTTPQRRTVTNAARATLVVETLIEVERSLAHILSAGFASGLAVTAVLNPYDRALFLSVRAKRPFLAASNWTTPFHGVGQTLVSRSLSTGLYFPLEELGEQGAGKFGLEPKSAATSVVAGNFAGVCNALLLSPLAAVKYRSWGSIEPGHDVAERRSVVAAALATYRRGGAGAFLTGLNATVLRDMTFGAVFALMRRQLRNAIEEKCHCDAAKLNTPSTVTTTAATTTQVVAQTTAAAAASSSEQRKGVYCFLADAAAAGAAAIVSGPLNYARNRQFAHISRDDVALPTIRDCLAHFADEIRRRPTLYAQARYAQTRLMVGWGTLRVAAGMALSALCYDLLNDTSS